MNIKAATKQHICRILSDKSQIIGEASSRAVFERLERGVLPAGARKSLWQTGFDANERTKMASFCRFCVFSVILCAGFIERYTVHLHVHLRPTGFLQFGVVSQILPSPADGLSSDLVHRCSENVLMRETLIKNGDDSLICNKFTLFAGGLVACESCSFLAHLCTAPSAFFGDLLFNGLAKLQLINCQRLLDFANVHVFANAELTEGSTVCKPASFVV